MGEHGALGVALVLQEAARRLQDRAVALLHAAAVACSSELRMMGHVQVAAGELLRAAGECTLQSLQEAPSEADAKAWHLARLERLAEVVGRADTALARAAEPAAEAGPRLGAGLPLTLERGITRRVLRALAALQDADLGGAR